MLLDLEIRKWLGRVASAFADQGLFGASGFLLNILLARWLPSDQYGAYALAFSIYLIIAGLETALLLEPMSVFGPASYKNALPDYLGRLIPLHFAVTLALGLSVGVGATLFGAYLKSSDLSSALWGVSLGSPWILLFWLWRRAAYLDLRPDVAMRGAALNVFTVLALLALFHALGWLSVFAAFVVQGIAGIAASLPLILSVRPRLRVAWTDSAMRTVLKQHWTYGRWVILSTIVFWLAGDAYYVIVASTMGMSDVAAFRAVQNFIKPISQYITAVTLLLVPWASARFADGAGQSFRRSINRITLIFTAGAVAYVAVLIFFGKWLTGFLYGGKYTQFAYLLPLMGLPILLMAAAEGPSIALRAMQAPSEIFRAYAMAALPTILAGVALTRNWGLMGAALGLAISSFAFLAVITYRYRTRLEKEINVRQESGSDFAHQNLRVSGSKLNRAYNQNTT